MLAGALPESGLQIFKQMPTKKMVEIYLISDEGLILNYRFSQKENVLKL